MTGELSWFAQVWQSSQWGCWPCLAISTSPSPQGQDRSERAKGAAAQVGDVVADQGLAGLVRARVTTAFGLEAARYLHVRADDGHVLVYGLRPPSVTAEELAARARGVPGVKKVDVQTLEWPEYMQTAPAPEADAGDGG